MSGRALLAIGCNVYDHLRTLQCAEADAISLFETLVKPDVGDYDAVRSRLLLSPSLTLVRETLATMLFGAGSLDTLTITFAGHGAVSGGSFYMAMRDSRAQGLSATALSLADLFRMIAEAAPKQSYLVIDACQSGGLIADLNVILKSEVMGELGTPGVTLLAMAASNEVANEVGGHGIGTAALLSCIRGDIVLQDSKPALDLVEIGRAVSERVSSAGLQTPVVWGLNLYGPAGFCKNPLAGTGNAPLRSVLVGWPDAKTTAAIRLGLPRLWEPYVSIATQWEPRAFIERLTPLLSELQSDPIVMIDFIRRVTEACAVRAQDSHDRFREVEVSATCAVALLPFANDLEVSNYLTSCCSKISHLVDDAVGKIIKSIKDYRYALVTGGMADLYYLPLRLSKLLGWAGYGVHSRLAFALKPDHASTAFAELYTHIFDTYSLSLVAMTDSQAPYVISALTASTRVGLHEQGERLLGHLFASAVNCAGRVARSDLDPERVLGYLVSRDSHPKQPNIELVAQPTELVMVLLRSSSLFDLTHEIDVSLPMLDHLALNAYLPSDYSDFGAEHIAGGVNALFQVGHDFWRVSELEAAWPDFPSPDSPAKAMTSLLACLLFPDRSPWFLLPCPPIKSSQS